MFVISEDINETIIGLDILSHDDLQCFWALKAGIITVQGVAVQVKSREASTAVKRYHTLRKISFPSQILLLMDQLG
jgi:hypothetical protein